MLFTDSAAVLYRNRAFIQMLRCNVYIVAPHNGAIFSFGTQKERYAVERRIMQHFYSFGR